MRDGRRKFVLLGSSATLIQVAVGLVALHEGAASIPWPSLAIRPAVTLVLLLTVARLGRASGLLSGWLGLLAAGYGIGIASAHSPLLSFARATALMDLAFGAFWLQTSPAIQGYLHRRRL
ncbi:MAG: hypothetical protein ACJ791_07735 [Gemmatimonadaceae bacterium]